ncbi:YqaE/Pmp3 family membrane protein [Cryomorpha ignava]|nr:YqaE/Pmp3 family membrane protein [Cryomorpha ignava]
MATAKMENVQPNEIVREQSPVLAQASTSNEITEADVKSPSVFSAPEKSETLGNRTEKAINTIDSERKADKKTKSNLSNKKLRSKAVSAVPQAGEANMVLYIILAIILPPLAVGLLYGIGTEFLISLVLTLLFFLPGVIYALIMVLKKG